MTTAQHQFESWYGQTWMDTQIKRNQWKSSSVEDIAKSAWQHQQQRIDELENSLQITSDAMCSGNELIKSLQATIVHLEKDAKRWNYFIEKCSAETAFELTGNSEASNEDLNNAMDEKIKQIEVIE